MAKATSYAPEGIRTLTPTLTLKNAREAVEWYKKAFDAHVRVMAEGPTPGSTIHGEIRIGDSLVPVGGCPALTKPRRLPSSVRIAYGMVSAENGPSRCAGVSSHPENAPPSKCGDVLSHPQQSILSSEAIAQA